MPGPKGEVNMSDAAVQIVWTRRVNLAAQHRRWVRLGLWYGAPVSVAIVGTALCVGVGEAFGLMILLGGFGMMLAVWLFLTNFVERQNGELRLHPDGVLQWGQKRIHLNRVDAWTTRMDEFRAVTSTPSGPRSMGQPSARVLFRYAQPEVEVGANPLDRYRVIFWIRMSEAELEEVRACLEPHIPAPWVPPDQLKTD